MTCSKSRLLLEYGMPPNIKWVMYTFCLKNTKLCYSKLNFSFVITARSFSLNAYHSPIFNLIGYIKCNYCTCWFSTNKKRAHTQHYYVWLFAGMNIDSNIYCITRFNFGMATNSKNARSPKSTLWPSDHRVDFHVMKLMVHECLHWTPGNGQTLYHTKNRIYQHHRWILWYT